MIDCPHPELYARDGFNQMQRWGKCLLCERDALAARLAEAERLLDEVRPMVQSYRRKHEKAFDAASRKLFTELAEKHAETMGKCDRILAAIGAADSASGGAE
jgi:hypothetical protein